MKRNYQEAMIQVALGVLFLLCFYGVFTLLQQEQIYTQTLGRYAETYERLDTSWNITAVKKPYRKISESNLVIWDVAGYHFLKDNAPSENEVRFSYGFFPMFPWIWKLTMLPVNYIGIFNFFLFVISVIILMRLLTGNAYVSIRDRILMFLLALSVPSVIIYLMPYSEAVFTLTFTLALWGLFRKRYWIYFVFMVMAAMSRASVVIVIASVFAADAILLLRHRDVKHFLKEVLLKLLPIITGMFLVFTYHYIYSGNFFKYYEVQSTYWTNNIQLPRGLSDWSIEGFGMNVAAIFFVALPGLLWFFSNENRHQASGIRHKGSVFGGNAADIKDYFFLNAIVFFTGFFLYVALFRGGSVHCLHRFIVSSPYFFIFFLMIPEKFRNISPKALLLFTVPLIIHGLYLVRTSLLPLGFEFRDSGFFIFMMISVLLVFLKQLPAYVKWPAAIIIVLYSIVWLTFLYNQYLSNAWIFA